jgi:glycosyltransferase involved in cell wall biosynthesis
LALAAYRFPHGDAMSNRLLQLARSGAPPGGVAVVVNDWPDDGTRPPIAPRLPPGVRLITLGGSGGGGGLIRRWMRRTTRALRVLSALRRAGIPPGSLVGVQVPLGLWNLTTWVALRIVLHCPLTVDVTERHEPGQFARGRRDPAFIRHRWAGFLAGRLADRVIAVSVTIERHFIGRGRRTLVVPPQVDQADYAEPGSPPVGSGIRLLYAGTAGPKDMLAVVLAGILRLPPVDRTRVRLVIAGLTLEQARSRSDLTGGVPRELAGQVDFLGRVSRERVLAELRRSHFSVLVRPTGGYAQAGFPSKVPESLAAGCPVLLNYTGDLADYIVDGREGIVLAGSTAADVAEGLARALILEDRHWQEMSRAARERARCFDYRTWTPAVSDFMTGPGPKIAAPVEVSR